MSSNLLHHYPNCDAAWADGRTNIRRGDADHTRRWTETVMVLHASAAVGKPLINDL